jgi:hypothetical protein
MNNRPVQTLQPSRQAELHRQYPWLEAVHVGECPGDVKLLSISVFDHWLSREEACRFLERIPPEEKALRDARHARFCALLVAGTPVFSFSFRRRDFDNLVFLEFTSKAALSRYCTPNGGRTLSHRHFNVALPELNCVFFESWDDTHHFYFTDPASMTPIHEWAHQSGLHLLSRR